MITLLVIKVKYLLTTIYEMLKCYYCNFIVYFSKVVINIIYLITYDLNSPGKNYDQLYSAIKSVGFEWWHPLQNIWFVKSTSGSSYITKTLTSYVDVNDKLFVCKANSDWAGYNLPTNFVSWINSL